MSRTKIEKRQEVERKVVRHLIRTMKEKGWNAYKVNDGEEIVKTSTESEVMDAVFSVDESWIRFKKDGVQGHRTAYIVLGNDGWDAICDHSLSDPDQDSDDFEKIMGEEINPYCESLEG